MIALILTLGLGSGALTAVFVVFDAVLLRPLPYSEPERLVDVLATKPRRGLDRVALAPADFLAWQNQSRSFESIGAYRPFGSLDLLASGSEPERLTCASVSLGLLDALRLPPLAGRWFNTEEYRAGAPRVVLLSENLWRTRFAARADVVGSVLQLSGNAYQVAGIVPRALRIPGGEPDLVTPLTFQESDGRNRHEAYLGAIGRLRAGTTIDEAQAELTAITRRLDRELGPDDSGASASALALQAAFTRRVHGPLWALLWAAISVAVVASLNAGGLLRARAIARQGEVAIRLALGATRWALLRERLTEVAILGTLASVTACSVGWLALRILPDTRGIYLSPSLELAFTPRSFTLGVAAAVASTGLAFAVARQRSAQFEPALRSGRAGTLTPGSRRLIGALGLIQAALATVVLLGALLLLRAFSGVQATEQRFEPDHALTFDLNLPAARYAGSTEVHGFAAAVLERLNTLPGVSATAIAKELPPREPWGFKPSIVGTPPDGTLSAGWEVVTPGYFAALGLPLVRGRVFLPSDRVGSERVAVVNESADRRLGGGASLLGRELRFNGETYRVAGVVRDGLENLMPPGAGGVVYLPFDQDPVPAEYLRSLSFVVRGETDAHRWATEIRARVKTLDAELPISGLATLEERLATWTDLGQVRFNVALGATFALLAAWSVGASLAGALALFVGQRRREIGIRLALGATPNRVAGAVVAQAIAIAGSGALLGLGGALALQRSFAGLVHGLSELDAASFVLTVGALLALATVAAIAPARTASATDPASSLRAD